MNDEQLINFTKKIENLTDDETFDDEKFNEYKLELEKLKGTFEDQKRECDELKSECDKLKSELEELRKEKKIKLLYISRYCLKQL